MIAAAGSARAQSAEPPKEQASAASSAPAQPQGSAAAPIAIDQLTLDDDLLGAVGWRPIDKRRVELLAATGNESTHQAALRASDTVGGVGIELTGTTATSDAVAVQSEAGARIEHATQHNRARLYASYGSAQIGAAQQSFTTDLRAGTYGGAWTAWRSAGRFELHAFGEQQQLHDTRTNATHELDTATHALGVGFASRRVQALGLGHELGVGIDVVQAAGTATEESDTQSNRMTMVRTRHGRHRFLRGYIHDTVRVIESLDVHGGFVFEHWRWLSNLAPIGGRDAGENMDADTGQVLSQVLLDPSVGAMYRVGPELTIVANAYRRMGAPTWQQLMRPVQNGDVLVVADDELRATTIIGGEAGPSLATRDVSARAVVYWNEIASPIVEVTVDDQLRERTNLDRAHEAGVQAAVSMRLGKPWLASIDYTYAHARITKADTHPELVGNQLPHMPRHRATVQLVYDDPKVITVSGSLRYADRRFEDDRNTRILRPFATVDAMAARALTHGFTGFVAVENLFDRRYVTNQVGVDTIGAPRLVQVGVRLDTARW